MPALKEMKPQGVKADTEQMFIILMREGKIKK